MATEEMIGPVRIITPADLDRIRKRVSYRDFKDLSKLLDTNPGKATILTAFWNAIDRHNGYGSQRNADAALESMELVLRDEGVKV